MKASVYTKIIVFLLVITAFNKIQAQTDSLFLKYTLSNNQRTVLHIFEKDTFLTDSLPIVSSSLKIFSNKKSVPASCFELSGNKIKLSSLCFNPKDSIIIEYRVLPFAFQSPVFKKDRNLLGKETNLGEDFVIGQPFNYNPFAKTQDQMDFKGLEYSGSFSRGLSLGNRQDLILNSGFNLQVGGKIGEIEISGAISDNNIPLQPDGNTQQLQDFDRIYLQFKYKNSYLLAGDYDLKKSEKSYFLNYFRRTQGAQLGTSFKLKNGAQINSDLSFAISRGTFTRYIFDGQEGNQGPYRLKGANGEVFLIVIAGTERVFMDGELLTRGADYDYVIDYNLGEIKFTNKRLITKDKRIQIEFSYSDLNYVRTINTFNSAYKTNDYTFRVHWYSEEDAKNQTTQNNLSDSAKAVLRRIGNNTDQAVIWGASIPAEDQNFSGLVKYKLIDTLIAGVLYDSVLVYSTNTDSAIYTVKFTEIKTGGHYIKINNATNGTVFSWIAPDSISGQLRGSHEPIELLTTPKTKQMLDLGVDLKVGKSGALSVDLAMSNRDLNTFSKINDDENLGFSSRLSYTDRILVHKKYLLTEKEDKILKDSSMTNLLLGAHYEFVQNKFEVVEPYRTREFQRDWNTTNLSKTNEHWMNAKVGIQNNKWGQLFYQFGALLKDSVYTGTQHQFETNVRHRNLQLLANATYTESLSGIGKFYFLRPKADLSYNFKKFKQLKIGFYFEQEQNRSILSGSDSLSSNSFYFNVFKFYAEIPNNDKFSLKSSVQRRYDYFTFQKNFNVLTIADEMNLGGEWNVSKISQLQWNLNYRNLRITDTTKTSLDPKETYLGRIEYNLNIRKGFIRLNSIYELGAGQQQKLAYNYIQVDKGMGTHIWIDRNEDGVQQQNEFEQAIFQDQADFLRVTILTNEFIRTNNVSLSQSIDIEPSVLTKAKNSKKNLKWLGKFSSRSIFKIERKTTDDANIAAFNPFQLNIADSSLLSVGSTIRNIVYFNRSETKFRVEFQQSDIRNKTLLNIGFESRRKSDYSLLPSFKLSERFRAQFSGIFGFNENSSEFFPERNYMLRFFEFQPQLIFMQKTLFRSTLQYKYKESKNQIGLLESAKSHDITLEAKYSKSGKYNTSVRASFSWINLQFEGRNNTPVQFAMTDGLLNGQNFLWSLSIDRSLSKNILLNIGYEGRKTGEAAVVHVGRAQIRAVF